MINNVRWFTISLIIFLIALALMIFTPAMSVDQAKLIVVPAALFSFVTAGASAFRWYKYGKVEKLKSPEDIN